MAERSHQLLEEACTAAGIELGSCDSRILAWLADWEPEICVVVAELTARAHQAGVTAGTWT